MKLLDRLLKIREKNGAGYFVLLDPDSGSVKDLVGLAQTCQESGVDALLVGGSLLFSNAFDTLIQEIKKAVTIPVILFPGDSRQLSKHADGLLFMSLISGRNPHYLIGEQVLSAPTIHALGLETIPTGYMLVESGKMTSVEFISNTKPLPRNKPDIAVAHALAAQYMGMQILYLEGGSGADHSVPIEMIQAVSQKINIPLIIGGGIRTAEQAKACVEAGASFIVTGTIIEKSNDSTILHTLAEAIHSSCPKGIK